MLQRIRTALRHDRGASAVEYGLLVSAIAAVIVAIVVVFGNKVKENFAVTCNAVASSQGSTC